MPELIKNPVFCALDTTDCAVAVEWANALAGSVGGIKLGLEFFNRNGHDGVAAVARSGLPIFLDLKFHDIPNTVAGALRGIAPLNPAFINVHALGGSAVLAAAVNEAKNYEATSGHRIGVLAVTILTSMNRQDLQDVGIEGTPEDAVGRLVELGLREGVDGFVCSPFEIEMIRALGGPDISIVTPGIRPAGSEIADQKRFRTPCEAVAAGASYIVIGRPITRAPDPARAAAEILASLAG